MPLDMCDPHIAILSELTPSYILQMLVKLVVTPEFSFST